MHDPRRGSPSGVTVGTACPRDGNIDAVFARSHTGTLTNDNGRIVVVVANLSVHRARHRRSTRFTIHLHFPATPLVTAHNAQVVVVQDTHADFLVKLVDSTELVPSDPLSVLILCMYVTIDCSAGVGSHTSM